MNTTTCTTHACTIEELDPGLKNALRAHGKHFSLEDIESEVLMCCETKAILQRSGWFGAKETSISAAYLTPKWLVWADSSGPNDVVAGAVPLNQMDVRDHQSPAQYTITPAQGLNITGRYTDTNKTGITFIVLEAEAAHH